MEVRKREKNTHDLFDNDYTEGEALSQANKLRLFYVNNVIEYVWDAVMYMHLINRLRYFRIAIGVKNGSGGMNNIFSRHCGDNESDIKHLWEPVVQYASDVYDIDLTDRVSEEGDFSGFDFTLLGIVLGYIASMIIPQFLADDNINEEMLQIIFLEFIKNGVYKTLYINGLDRLYHVWGRMFSGKLWTSTGNSTYQAVVNQVYIDELAYQNRDNELIQLIFQYHLFVADFSGDDHLLTSPKYLQDFLLYPESKTLLEDYITFVTVNFKMEFKWAARVSVDNTIGMAVFVSNGKGYNLVAERVGSTLLKTSIRDVYVAEHYDGEDRREEWLYVGRFPYRESSEIFSKIGYSLTAGKNIYLWQCLLVSWGYMCFANLEAFFFCKVFMIM
jgi:hypothetical protein